MAAGLKLHPVGGRSSSVCCDVALQTRRVRVALQSRNIERLADALKVEVGHICAGAVSDFSVFYRGADDAAGGDTGAGQRRIGKAGFGVEVHAICQALVRDASPDRFRTKSPGYAIVGADRALSRRHVERFRELAQVEAASPTTKIKSQR